jgi:hypothetical protein
MSRNARTVPTPSALAVAVCGSFSAWHRAMMRGRDFHHPLARIVAMVLVISLHVVLLVMQDSPAPRRAPRSGKVEQSHPRRRMRLMATLVTL